MGTVAHEARGWEINKLFSTQTCARPERVSTHTYAYKARGMCVIAFEP